MSKADIRALKNATEVLSRWPGTQRVFGHFERAKASKKIGDRLYEFYCYMRVVRNFKSKYQVRFVSGTKGNTFPLSPTTKAGYSRFELFEKGTNKRLMQLCYGTSIRLSHSPPTSHAPDISFQLENSPDDPEESHVVLIMDAKFKNDSDKALQKNLLSEFGQWVNDFNLKRPTHSHLDFDIMPELNGNCLITNGKAASIVLTP